MPSQLSWALSDLWIAWQPIVDLADGRVLGYEALARGPKGTAFESPAALFRSATGERRSRRLEQHLRALALRDAALALGDDMVAFVNVNCRWPEMPLDAAAASLPPARVAIEVSESQPILENDGVLAQVAAWRQAGHPIVLDDYGTGYAAAAAVLALQPDLVKLDRQLIVDIDRDVRRQAIVRSIRDYTAELGIRTLAEGVETAAELATVRALGLDMAQGFLLARPASPPPAAIWPMAGPAATMPARHAPDARLADPLLALYAASAQGANLPVYVVDRQRRVVGWNALAAKATGYSAEEMLGHRCFEPGGLRHRDLAGRPLCVGACPIVWSLVNGAPHSALISLATKDGQRRLVRTLATPVWDAARQRVLGVVEQFEVLDSAHSAEATPLQPRMAGLGVDLFADPAVLP